MNIALLGAGGKMGCRLTANLRHLSHYQINYVESSAARISIEQMAILEPAVVESTMATCVTVLREAMEAAVQKGVPKASRL